MAYATEADLRAWMSIGDSVQDQFLSELLDTATEWIDQHCGATFGPTDDDADATVPDAVRTACLLLASRLWDRRQSPGGVLGTNNDIGVIRITGSDRDVEKLLAPHRAAWGIA